MQFVLGLGTADVKCNIVVVDDGVIVYTAHVSLSLECARIVCTFQDTHLAKQLPMVYFECK